MVGVLTLHQTSIGKKVIMAVTGLIMFGFIIFHMYGNLKAFQGPTYFNEYAEGLRALGEPVFGQGHLLWVARLGLLGAFGLHIWSAWELYRQSQGGRTNKYQRHQKLRSSYAAQTIRWGGVIILIFVIYHLMHFTFGVPGIHSDFQRGDAYHNLVSGFQSTPVAIVYIIAVSVLGLHLYHGTWSMCQTLGIARTSYTPAIRGIGLILALVVSLGFASVPLSIMFGFIN